MELVAYLHSETICERLFQGESVDQTLDCHLLDAIANSSRYAKSALCVGLATGMVAINMAPAAYAYVPEIALVQSLLARRGFNPGEVDGVKGESTTEAIIAAQVFYGLEADGVIGAETLAALQDDPYEFDEAASEESTMPEDDTEAIKNLQQLLSDRGFYGGEIDGIEGAMTTEAIVLAQKTYGLIADGVAGSLTIAALEADQGSVADGGKETEATPEEGSLEEGQTLLSELGFYEGEVDGIQGLLTTTAIKKAQAFYGLTVDGILGEQTLAALRA
ncbi:MAG: hypothetical protein DCE90_17360 [Pseudanabaena sp.]|nr:MAG: hypothetical protein DCE90_17360 [Pseudanabaena sp.]